MTISEFLNDSFQINLVSRPFWKMDHSIELYTYNLLLALNKLKRENNLNIDVNLIETGYKFKKVVPPYGNTMSPIFYDLLAPLTLTTEAKRKPSVVHIVHHLLSPYALKLRETPILVTIHHVPELLDHEYSKLEEEWFEMFYSELSKYISKYPAIKSLRLMLQKLRETSVTDMFYSLHDVMTFKAAIWKASAYLAVSSLTALELKLLFPKYVNKKKIYVTPLAPPQDVILLPIKKQKDKQKKIVIGYIGSHINRKATYLIIPLALRVKEAMKSSYFNARIYIYGSGPILYTIKKLTTLLNLNDIIEFKGIFDRKSVASEYHNLDILFLPSIKEGFGLPILEAATAGIPTIVFNKAKIPKEIKDLCIKVNNFDEIIQVLVNLASSSESYENLNLHVSASKFSWDLTAKETLRAYIEASSKLK
jgi:hypothetical protein